MNDPSPKSLRLQAQKAAQQGESYRLQGHFSNAYKEFSKALQFMDALGVSDDDQALAWVRGHRGAVIAAMGAFEAALEDFDAVLEGRPDYVWVAAQRAEALRCRARDHLGQEDFDTVYAWVVEAIEAFGDVHEAGGDTAWTLAHKAASHTLGYLVANHCLEEAEDAGDQAAIKQWTARRATHKQGAHELYQQVDDRSRAYPWADAFWAIQFSLQGDEDPNPKLDDRGRQVLDRDGNPMVLDSYEEAKNRAGEAMLYDPGVMRNLLRYLTALYTYREDPSSAIRVGWQTLRNDPEDWFANYFLAQALSEAGDPSAEKVCMMAYQQLLKVGGVVAHMKAQLEAQVPAVHAMAVDDNVNTGEVFGFEAMAVHDRDVWRRKNK